MNEFCAEKTPKLSLWSLMKSINVFSQDTVSIRTIRSILSELIPLSVYFPDIAESDILTKEMITNAYNHKGACFGCSKNCKDSDYYPYCFLLEASIKYDNLRFKRDTQNLNQLVGDVFSILRGTVRFFIARPTYMIISTTFLQTMIGTEEGMASAPIISKHALKSLQHPTHHLQIRSNSSHLNFGIR